MNAPHDDVHENAQIEQMVQFDEALRLGRRLENDSAADPDLQETQDFLLLLQSVWKRKLGNPLKSIKSRDDALFVIAWATGVCWLAAALCASRCMDRTYKITLHRSTAEIWPA